MYNLSRKLVQRQHPVWKGQSVRQFRSRSEATYNTIFAVLLGIVSGMGDHFCISRKDIKFIFHLIDCRIHDFQSTVADDYGT